MLPYYKRFTFILIVCLLTCCTETNTNDPAKAFRYWYYSNAPPDVKVLHGKYWSSAHWSTEYTVYLELRTSNKWWKEFIKEKHLKMCMDSCDVLPYDAPKWFNPSPHSTMWIQPRFTEGSIYVDDSLTGMKYIYDIQL